MTTHAGAIAAKLQGAHERRQRGEDKDMGEATTEQVQQFGSSVWDDDPFVRALNLSAELGKVLGDIAASGHAPDENAGRVAELERQLEDMNTQALGLAGACEQAERERDEARAELAAFDRAQDLGAEIGHVDCYVAREVPWSDVAAGMMTISAQDVPFLVQEVSGGAWALEGLHDGKVVRFEKRPKPGETVRVLVPYVTPEAAEAAVREQLGGRA